MIGTTLGLLLGGAIGAKTATDIYGAHKAGKAAEQASQQQQQAAQQAIAYGEPLYQRALGIAEQQAAQGRAGLEPFRQAGYGGMQGYQSFGQGLAAPAMTSLTSLLGLPGQTGGGFIPPMQAGAASGGAFLPAGQRVAQQAPGLAQPTVMLRAPNGQQQAVPADHAEFYLARGATRV
jgi:hypothetical protein